MQESLREHRQEELEERRLQESGGDENVVVCVRVRPFNRREMDIQHSAGGSEVRSVVEMPNGLAGQVTALERRENGSFGVVERFQFTKSFWSISDDQQTTNFAPVGQEDVFEHIGIPVIKTALAGFHNCVFAYGQTGSGKTHTMMGDFQAVDGRLDGIPGIIPQLCKELFDKIEFRRQRRTRGVTQTFDVKLSAIEIYNEQVRDLFWRSTPGRTKGTVLKVRKHPVEGAFVDQLTLLNPANWVECVQMIESGISERTVAATLMNDESSRSHSVFQITLTQTETVKLQDEEDEFAKPMTHKRVSRINLIDLAGSERLKKSGAQGQHLKEAATINNSLSTLKKVIDAIIVNSKEPNPKKHVIVPFRESTLTMLLSHSLGGNSKTTMIACVSPHYDNQEETLLTLRYANRAKGIVNHTSVNEDNSAKAALALKRELLALQRRLDDGEDDEVEELRDQLEIGRSALKQIEADNRKLQRSADDARTRTKAEEGARYAAAFFNSVKTSMLLEQKEALDASIADADQRLREQERELEALRAEMRVLEEAGRVTLTEEAELMALESERTSNEKRLLKRRGSLESEAHAVRQRLERELEKRYASRILTNRRLRRERVEQESSIAGLRREQAERLDNVIQEAAEQYTVQVREYSDKDSAVKHRITELEAQLPVVSAQRAAAEEEAETLLIRIREQDREHAKRIATIDSEWRHRYQEAKQQCEAEVTAAEQRQNAAREALERAADEARRAEAAGEAAQVSELEAELRARERFFSDQTSRILTEGAATEDEMLTEEAEKHTAEMDALRAELEGRMAVSFGHLEAAQREEREAKAMEERLTAELRQREAMATRLQAALDGATSPESLRIKAAFQALEVAASPHRSTRPTAESPRSDITFQYSAASPGAQLRGAASPGRRRVILPPSVFFPLK